MPLTRHTLSTINLGVGSRWVMWRIETAAGTLTIPYQGSALQEFKDRAEREFIVAALESNDWNVAATAKAIGTPRSNLYKKLDAYGISRNKDDNG